MCNSDISEKEFRIVVRISKSSSEAVQAIEQLMDMVGLSADGKDKRAVYAWFMERYRPGVTIPMWKSEDE